MTATWRIFKSILQALQQRIVESADEGQEMSPRDLVELGKKLQTLGCSQCGGRGDQSLNFLDYIT